MAKSKKVKKVKASQNVITKTCVNKVTKASENKGKEGAGIKECSVVLERVKGNGKITSYFQKHNASVGPRVKLEPWEEVSTDIIIRQIPAEEEEENNGVQPMSLVDHVQSVWGKLHVSMDMDIKPKIEPLNDDNMSGNNTESSNAIKIEPPDEDDMGENDIENIKNTARKSATTNIKNDPKSRIGNKPKKSIDAKKVELGKR